ncbi:MAG: hypothetical protein ACOY31_12435 [Bacillota bacterium]
MRKKYCPRCKMASYSACKDVWTCPYCGEDMSSQPDYDINDDSDNIKIRDEEDNKKKTLQPNYWLYNSTQRQN